MVADFCVLPSEGRIMMRYAAIAALVVFFSIVSVHAQTLDSALAFFPTSIGDMWEYAIYSGYIGPPGQLVGHWFSEFKGDTVVSDGKAYRILRSGPDQNNLTYSAYYRVDSTIANVYSYSAGRVQESLWDSLRDGLGDRNQWGIVFDVVNEVILGTSTVTKVSGWPYHKYSLSYGFGNTREYTENPDESTSLYELVYAKINGKEYGTILAVVPTGPTIPTEFELRQNYPNPFNPSTTIQYGLPQRSRVTLTVFNTPGQQVATLVNAYQEAGYHDVRFDASGLASGVYFYRLRAGDCVATKRLIVVR